MAKFYATDKLEKKRPKRRPGVHKKNVNKRIKLKRTLVRHLGLALLNMGKPFTSVGNWFWKLHRRVLDWND